LVGKVLIRSITPFGSSRLARSSASNSLQLIPLWQPGIPEQKDRLLKRRVDGQIVDVVPGIDQYALVTIDETDIAGRGDDVSAVLRVWRSWSVLSWLFDPMNFLSGMVPVWRELYPETEITRRHNRNQTHFGASGQLNFPVQSRLSIRCSVSGQSVRAQGISGQSFESGRHSSLQQRSVAPTSPRPEGYWARRRRIGADQ
jgi:hypothetical protein